MPLELYLHDVVRLRKPHPCGGYEWQVVRLGADIGMVCLTCHHRVLLPRREFEKRVKKFISRGNEITRGNEVTRGNELARGNEIGQEQAPEASE